MGFKSMSDYNDERYGNFFRLQNDQDYADVVILYRGTQDVMVADTHYIKSDEYSGYVTCCDSNCPACRKGIRVQPKLFVPVYVINTSVPGGQTNCVQFWDRSTRFQAQLVNDVFRGYPTPVDYIFRITRHGIAGDINTTYDIRAIKNNDMYPYDAILNQFNITFPDAFNMVCKEVNSFELESMMSTSGNQGGYSNAFGNQGNFNQQNNFGATPRGGFGQQNNGLGSELGNIPGTEIPYTSQNAPNLSMPNVPINASVPNAAPDPSNLPFGEAKENNSLEPVDTPSASNESEVDPLQTNEDIDTTDLDF